MCTIWVSLCSLTPWGLEGSWVLHLPAPLQEVIFLACWLSCQGFRRWNLYYHGGLKGSNTVNSIFKVILWKLLISVFQGFALYSEALGITSFYLLGFIWGFTLTTFLLSPPPLWGEVMIFHSLFLMLKLFCVHYLLLSHSYYSSAPVIKTELRLQWQ